MGGCDDGAGENPCGGSGGTHRHRENETGNSALPAVGGRDCFLRFHAGYRGLPIGTAQPTQEELAAAPHHLIGFLEVDQPFSVSDYVEAAGRAIQEISGRGRLPVLVGGTGLYARSLLRGFSFEENGRDEEVRQRLFRQAEEQGPETLYQCLCRLDPKAAEEIHPHNVKRVVRALEYIQLCGNPFPPRPSVPAPPSPLTSM